MFGLIDSKIEEETLSIYIDDNPDNIEEVYIYKLIYGRLVKKVYNHMYIIALCEQDHSLYQLFNKRQQKHINQTEYSIDDIDNGKTIENVQKIIIIDMVHINITS